MDTTPRQLRLIIETDDFAETVRFYRDVLGMGEQPAFATGGEDRVAILHAGLATIEVASAAHARAIDEVEGAPPVDGVTLRLALEVDDTAATVAATEQAGVRTIAPPVRTPFRTLNARVQGPAGWQVTFFQELESLDERARREGFSTDAQR
jgi:catechol 2,3-dioxygenase-like lactoylglutathione lyase family enzyme